MKKKPSGYTKLIQNVGRYVELFPFCTRHTVKYFVTVIFFFFKYGSVDRYLEGILNNLLFIIICLLKSVPEKDFFFSQIGSPEMKMIPFQCRLAGLENDFLFRHRLLGHENDSFSAISCLEMKMIS